MDCSLPGSSVHGIFQARAMEWGAIAFSSEESGWTQIQLILINLPQPCTPPHVYTKRKTPECLQSSLTSVVTAILCPSRSNWGPVSQPTFDRTEETPYISKASCFFFFFELRLKYCFIFLSVELSYESLRCLFQLEMILLVEIMWSESFTDPWCLSPQDIETASIHYTL